MATFLTDVFISHSHAYEKYAEELVQILSAAIDF